MADLIAKLRRYWRLAAVVLCIALAAAGYFAARWFYSMLTF